MEAFFEKYQVEDDVKKLFEAEEINDSQFYKLEVDDICRILQNNMSTISSFLPNFYEGKSSQKNDNLDNPVLLNIPNLEVIVLEANGVASDNNELQLEQSIGIDDESTPVNYKESDERYFHANVPDNYIFPQNELYIMLNEDVDLEGQIILMMYRNCKTFLKTRLKNFITRKLIKENPITYKITSTRINDLANQVIEVFPTTDKKEWYRPPTKNSFGAEVCAAGCLVNYYKIYSQDLVKAGIKKSTARVFNVPESTTNEVVLIDLRAITDAEQDKYDIEILVATWKKSFSDRQTALLESDCAKIISDLAKASLISKNTCENFATKFTSYWPELSKEICLLSKSEKKSDIKAFRTKISIGQDGKTKINLDTVRQDILALLCLPFFVTKAQALKTAKGSFAFVREDISDHFVKIIKSESDFDDYKLKFEKSLNDIGYNVHPYVVFCGKLEAISKAYVVFNGNHYFYAKPLEAVEVCFKISIALHTWSRVCSPIWTFIQEEVYGIPPDVSCAFPAPKQLSFIRSFQKKLHWLGEHSSKESGSAENVQASAEDVQATTE